MGHRGRIEREQLMSSQSSSPGPEPRLSQILTDRSLFRKTVEGSPDARKELVMRYRVPVRRYLGAIFKDESDADELADEAAQNWLTKMLSGRFDGAMSLVVRGEFRGKFRYYLRTAVRNEARACWRRRYGREQLGVDLDRFEDKAPDPEAEDLWQDQCRRMIRAEALDALRKYQAEHGKSHAHTVLMLIVEHPAETSAQLADRLSASIGHGITPEAFRQQVQRARRRFAELLIEGVASTLYDPTPEDVEDELCELGLMQHVRDYLPSDWRTRGPQTSTEETSV
jgi:RNA polymerase sigma-70 factor (ECF subfamily)